VSNVIPLFSQTDQKLIELNLIQSEIYDLRCENGTTEHELSWPQLNSEGGCGKRSAFFPNFKRSLRFSGWDVSCHVVCKLNLPQQYYEFQLPISSLASKQNNAIQIPKLPLSHQ
jgi:hypothetical protein